VFAAVARRTLPPVDRRFRARRRTLASLGTGLPVCYLTTRGRRSGEWRTAPLLYLADGDRVVVAESNWGQRRRPSWALNLDENPEARLSIGGAERPVTARRATAAEEARYWPQLDEIWPGWEGYRRRAGRAIVLYVLEPSEARSS
jgi:deazaflavin-dependent oxidoreductase (nitroreductase family)